MRLEVIPLGLYQANCYLLIKERKLWVVDPGAQGEELASYIIDKGLSIQAVLLTHTHFDHILALGELVASFPPFEIAVHSKEAHYLGKQGRALLQHIAQSVDSLQGKKMLHQWDTLPEPTLLLEDNDYIQDIDLQVIHTPGHSPGGVCYYHRQSGTLISGDTLFAQSIGRTDLPFGDSDTLITSIKTKLLTLDENTIIYPGHGGVSTIIQEKQHNPFL
ncbi:MAG: MBL fold metallo-hydrolase [Sphaerochaetaceae bacterium]|jgi:hydroxyacylglutathione hydrolase